MVSLKKLIWLNMHRPEKVLFRSPIRASVDVEIRSWIEIKIDLFWGNCLDIQWEANQAYLQGKKDLYLDIDPDDIPF